MREGFVVGIMLSLIILVVDVLFYLMLVRQRYQFPKKYWFRVLFVFVALSIILAWWGLLLLTQWPTSSLVLSSFMWLIGTFLFVYAPKVTALVLHLFLELTNLFKFSLVSMQIQRRLVLGIALLPFIFLLYGRLLGAYDVEVKEKEVSIEGLHPDLENLKIVQISDLHLGSLNGNTKYIDTTVKLINDEQPDFCFFTGDLVNNFSEEAIGFKSAFAKLNPAIKKYAILGNHDYGDYSRWNSLLAKQHNKMEIINALRSFGFTVLLNNHVDVAIGNACLTVVGVENWGKPPFPQYGNLDKALAGSSKTDLMILLSHDPDHWKAEVSGNSRIQLTLSGHTHAMQLGLKSKLLNWSPAQYKFEHWDGLYYSNKQYLHVNRGIGFGMVPMRIGMLPEISVLHLVKK